MTRRLISTALAGCRGCRGVLRPGRDAFALSYVYFDDTARGANSTRMTKDEARRIANGIARLPDLMGAKVKP